MGIEPNSITARMRPLLDQYPPAGFCDLLIAGVGIRVGSNIPNVIDALRHYYRCFTATLSQPDYRVFAIETDTQPADLDFVPLQPRPGKTRIKDETYDFPDGRALRKRLTGMQFLFGGDLGIAVGPCLTNLNQVVNFINNRFMQRKIDEGFILAHASAVSQDHQGLAIAGMPGRGKSTLALHILNRGLDFTTNDGLLLRRTTDTLEMLGLAKYPRVNPGTLLHNPHLTRILDPADERRFRQLPPQELWQLEQKYDVDIFEFYGPERMQLHGTAQSVLILNWDRDAGPPQFAPVDLAARPELLEAVMKPLTINYFAPAGATLPDFSPQAYLDVLAGTPIYEASGGADFDAATDWCVNLLEHMDEA